MHADHGLGELGKHRESRGADANAERAYREGIGHQCCQAQCPLLDQDQRYLPIAGSAKLTYS